MLDRYIFTNQKINGERKKLKPRRKNIEHANLWQSLLIKCI